jgi:predicted O-linked N-acetylglucosamine transferase (SPINDLY family)
MPWHASIEPTLLLQNRGELERAIEWYEEIIEAEPLEIEGYWYLGLAYFLAGREEEAKLTWLFVLGQGEEGEVEAWTRDLVAILVEEAGRQTEGGNLDSASRLRQQIWELVPDDLVNLLYSIDLALIGQHFPIDLLDEWLSIERGKPSLPGSLPVPLLLSILEKILAYPHESVADFARVILPHLPDGKVYVQKVVQAIITYRYQYQHPNFAIHLTEIALEVLPEELYLWNNLFILYKITCHYSKALEAAINFSHHSRNSLENLFGQSLQIGILHEMGDWLNLPRSIELLKTSIEQIEAAGELPLQAFIRDSLLGITSCFPYYQDNPLANRSLQNQLAIRFQAAIQTSYLIAHKSVAKVPKKTLRIGYISHALRRHSVGWLSRWLLHYHDREAFHITLYLVNQPEDDITRNWFMPHANRVYNLSPYPHKIAGTILEDNLDILIDLDSITNNTTYSVMALKPAPIQVTWLGLDASGIPAIDYFIADPYVLPDRAAEYYREKIIRLPHTYLAIDGFEVGVPSQRREMFALETDAIIYLSVQTGLKRTPETIRLQARILKEVANSYLFIKGSGDPDTIRSLLTTIFESEGVSPDRLRFLPFDTSEEIHRANLTLADVILDTYPYNGATTTLEALWMGIPLVTRVGQQFAARNSYTFLTNAGISEGIAWSEEEYVRWGVEFGKNSELRAQVRQKLFHSRRTAPLWNGRAFTLEMENAYRQIWGDYCQTP